MDDLFGFQTKKKGTGMFGMESLDVLIGLVTVYLALALACTAIVEAIASWMSLRSKNLEAALTEFLAGNLSNNDLFIQAFYRHPLVQALSKGTSGRPSYVPPAVVGQVVLHILATASPNAATLKDAVDILPGTVETNRIKGILMALVVQAANDPEHFQKLVESHFDAVMDRASGWVKRRQQTVALLVSTLLVGAANVDTFAIATSLSSSPESRAKLVENAQQRLKEAQAASPSPAPAKVDAAQAPAAPTQPQPAADAAPISPAAAGAPTHDSPAPAGGPAQDPPNASPAAGDQPLAEQQRQTEAAIKAYAQATAALQTSGLNFGWKVPPTGRDWVVKILGLLISIFAVSLGAPFWFDVLQRFMQVRSAGVSPREKS
jgi:hypothetical protein